MKAVLASLLCMGLLAGCAKQPGEYPYMSNAFKQAGTAQECEAAANAEMRQARQTPVYTDGSSTSLIGAAIGKGIAMGIIESRAKRHLDACLTRVNQGGVVQVHDASSDGVYRGSEVKNARSPSVAHTYDQSFVGDRCPKNAPAMYRGDLICTGEN